MRPTIPAPRRRAVEHLMAAIEDIMVDPPAEGAIVDPAAWFDSPGPLEVEIGCGKGGFLLHRARNHPELRLLGIEWANKYLRYCADRMARWQLTNVRVMRTDASLFVRRHLAPGCVSVFHVYHPDPWPKKRHHKRRLFQTPFVEAAVRVLAPGGALLVQSDHEEYFAVMAVLLEARPELERVPWEAVVGEAGPEWQGTNFEIKYARAGEAIRRAADARRR